MTDFLQALDRGDLAAMTVFHLSAAFDIVDHATPLHRLDVLHGISGLRLY
jgi:hypothetical protein